jgi:hypothetical protein
VVAAGHTSVLMAMAGCRMPLESYPLQALVSEPVKPVFPCVVMSNTVHAYISQSDKGELVIGAGTDQYYSYSQTGGLHILEHTLEAICEMFPVFTRMKMLRSWGGIVDVTPDRSPILGQDAGAGALRQLRLGHGRLQGDARLGPCLRPHHRQRQSAPDQRALQAGALPHRPADRRSGGRRRRALNRHAMLLIRCPYCEEERPELEFRHAGEAHIVRPANIADISTRNSRPSSSSRQSQGRHPSAGATSMAAALLQRGARHGERPVRDDLQGGREEAGSGLQEAEGMSQPSASPMPAASTAANRPLHLRRAALSGFAGDTLASALLANGIHLVGRSSSITGRAAS